MKVNLRTKKQFLRICEDLKRFSERLHTQFPDAHISLVNGEISLIEKTGDSHNIVSSVKLPNFPKDKKEDDTKEKEKIEETNVDPLLDVKTHLLEGLKTKQNNKIFTIKSILGDTWINMTKDQQNNISLWFYNNVKSREIKNVKFSHIQKSNRFYKKVLE